MNREEEIIECIQNYTNGNSSIELVAKEICILFNISNHFSIGLNVKITHCIKGHDFKIGEIVELVDFDDNMWIARNKKGNEWYINEEEASVC